MLSSSIKRYIEKIILFKIIVDMVLHLTRKAAGSQITVLFITAVVHAGFCIILYIKKHKSFLV